MTRQRWEMDSRPVDVVLIGSQLVFGSVGMNGAAPVLREAGRRVAPLPTILLSNLPHYPQVHTTVLPADWLRDALEDLERIGVADEIGSVCAGYFAAPEQAEVVAQWTSRRRDRDPGLRVLVDPTLGDHDVGFYTDPRVGAALQRHLVPQATGLTPNLFELEQLTGTDLTGQGQADIVAAARGLLSGGTAWVVVTGIDGETPSTIRNLIITRDGERAIEHERVETAVKGAGDVFAAALEGALATGRDLEESVTRAARTVQRRLAGA